jgi:hypothetical protein
MLQWQLARIEAPTKHLGVKTNQTSLLHGYQQLNLIYISRFIPYRRLNFHNTR